MAHPEPLNQREVGKIGVAFKGGRLHWSRPWAVAVLAALSREGNLPPWPGNDGPRSVVFVLPQIYGLPGGIQRYNRALLKAAGEVFPRAELAVASVNDESIPDGAAVRGRVHFVGAGPRTRFLHRTAVVSRALRSAWRHRPTLILCGHINLMPLVWLLGVMFGARTALVAHGVEAWSPARLRRWAAQQADQVLPVSHYTGARIREWGIREDRVSVLSNTVDGEEFRPIRATKDRRSSCVLTVARLERSDGYKGVDRMLQALVRIREQCPSILYRVVGTGDDLPRLRALADELGVATHVEFHGSASEEALLRLYNDSDLFVMLSVGEGFGIVFLESLACGVPAVAGDRDGSVDALLGGRFGHLVDPDDAQALVVAIVTALDRNVAKNAMDRQALRVDLLEAYGFERFRARVSEVLVGEHKGIRR
jgi:glycosyltransferase involved in cell wall biosynthesis